MLDAMAQAEKNRTGPARGVGRFGTRKKPQEKASEGRKKSLFTRVGDEAKATAQKALLLKTLKANDWNMTKTGEALEMGTGAGAGTAVIRALKELAPEEYERAKADDRVSPANRRKE